jgi:hypothetical protein
LWDAKLQRKQSYIGNKVIKEKNVMKEEKLWRKQSHEGREEIPV